MLCGRFLQTETGAIKGEWSFKMDVDDNILTNKYILNSHCAPNAVLDNMGDRGEVSQSIRGDRTNKLFVIEIKTRTGSLNMGQDI